MPARGPVPKRSTARRRRNKDSVVETVAAIALEVVAPEPDEAWHPTALAWYRSLSESGQSQFFEPSDWAAACYVAEVLSKNLRDQKFSGFLFNAVWSAMGDLLTTEASRRRVRMEIERDLPSDEVSAGVTAIADYRRQLA